MAVEGEMNRETPSRQGRLWLALIAVIGLCAFAVYRSALMRLGEVQLVGAKLLTPEKVLEIAGLHIGAPRWLHPVRQIESRLQSEPWIESVKAQWQWHRLTINLAERTAVGLLPYHDRYVALDASGIILELVDSPASLRLPVISGVSVTKALRGERVTHQGLADVLLALSWMADPLRRQVAEAHVDAERSVTFFMVGGATVRWGIIPDAEKREEAVREKVSSFGSFWSHVSKPKTASCQIDLRVDGKVIPSGCE